MINETIIAISQKRNIEKYNIGIPKIAPSILKISNSGIFKKRKRTLDKTMSFCSCLFFISVIFS